MPTSCVIRVFPHVAFFHSPVPKTIQHSNTFPTIPISKITKHKCPCAILVSDIGNYHAVSVQFIGPCTIPAAATMTRHLLRVEMMDTTGSPMLLTVPLMRQSLLPYALNTNTCLFFAVISTHHSKQLHLPAPNLQFCIPVIYIYNYIYIYIYIYVSPPLYIILYILLYLHIILFNWIYNYICVII